MKKIIRAVLLLLVIAGLVFAGVRIVMNRNGKKHAPLVSYEWSYGGDMAGSSSGLKIAAQGDRALVVRSRQDWYGQDPQVEEYLVPLSVLERVGQLFDEYGMYRFDRLPENRVYALDAGTASYRAGYADGASLRFSDTQRIPEKGFAGLKAIDGVIDEAVRTGERLPGLVPAGGSGDDGADAWRPADGTAGLRVSAYREGRLSYAFGNATGEDVELSGRTRVFRLEDGERVEIYADADEHSRTLYVSYYNEPETVAVGRLEPGSYVLVFGGVEAEFTIR